MAEFVPHSLNYDLVAFMSGILLALVSDWIIRIREVAVIIAISITALVVWSLLGEGAPGLAGLLLLLVEHVQTAVTSGFLIGMTIGHWGVSLARSLARAIRRPAEQRKSQRPRRG